MGFFDKIKNAVDSVKGDAEKRKILKDIETDAYAKQREIQEEIKWQEAVQKAEERGVIKAKTTQAERLKADLQERREKVKERKEKKAAEKAAKTASGSHMSQSMKNVVSATTTKKNAGTSIVGTSNKGAGSMISGNSKKSVSLVKK